MIFNTNKEKGNAALGLAIAYFSSNGYTVSIPLNDTQDYDLIVEKNVDLLFIFNADKQMFLIPCNDIKNKSTLNLSSKYLKYKVDMIN